MYIRLRNFAAFLLLLMLAGACSSGGGAVTVGSTDFSEQQIVAEMYAGALEEAGLEVERELNLGTREVVEPALAEGEIDLYPEYVGTALEYLNGGAGEASNDLDASLALLETAFAEKGVTVLEPAEAEDKNAIVVTPETAGEHGLAKISDLAEVDDGLVFGGPPECPERPLCLQGLEDLYGLEFQEFRPLDAGGPLTVAALEDGEIDVALMFTTQGIIADKGWLVLEDDMGLQPAENILPAIRSDALTDEIEAALNAVSAQLTTEEMTELNKRVDVDQEDPADVAQEWLVDKGIVEG